MRPARDRKPHAPPIAFRKTSASNGGPHAAAISGFEDGAGGGDWRIDAPGRTLIVQQGCPNGLWVIGIKGHIDGAGVFVAKEDFLPVYTAVSGAKEPALRTRAVGAAHGGDKNNVRIFGIDGDAADVARS